MVDNKKICFIMCSNDSIFEKEALSYIKLMETPDSYKVDAISVSDASSMAAGYNEAISATDAKYKIYLHQDVFIVNKYFLYDILSVFQNPRIGMAGMVGVLKMPSHGVMCYANRVGKIYANRILESTLWTASDFKEDMKEVEAIDGLLMATQYDLPWREDLFTGWDFYDISQSFEFRKSGYTVVVPHQDAPWCIHDEGMNNLEDYYHYRKIFVQEYHDMLPKE